jgi:hypothetical protein
MKLCKWTAEGKILIKPEVKFKGKQSHAKVRLEVDGGEIVAFAHEESVIKELGRLQPQAEIRLTGIIEPRDPKLASNKPYFLNVVYIEHL